MESARMIGFSKPRFCLVYLFQFLLLSLFCALSHPEELELCQQLYECGSITARFPFWGENRRLPCGHPLLKLQCHRDSNATILDVSKGVWFGVHHIDNNTNTMKLAYGLHALESICSDQLPNTALPNELFDFLPNYNNLRVFYQCNPPRYLENSECPWNHASRNKRSCDKYLNVNVPASFVADEDEWTVKKLESVLEKGFEVKIKVDEGECKRCQSSGSFCIFNNITQGCCKEVSEPGNSCSTTNSSSPGLSRTDKLVLGSAAGLIGGLLTTGGIIWLIHQRKKKQSDQYTTKDFPTMSSSSSKETLTTTTNNCRRSNSLLSCNSIFGNGSVYAGVKVFQYEELEEATNHFSKELGDGGFGTVYHGVLQDGRAVAVKRLYERSLKRVEQFRNEIEILKSLKHPNLVILYGCTSRHSRELLLVYEYICNGTLADHLHGRHARSLSWSDRLNIAIETASALSYLHASGIIHRDVKTRNILLDGNFQVKVADFGLSRLFPTDTTHVSTAPQGTPGYVDPEYYHCYSLNEKSDVYSFGVVLAELISSKQPVDVTRHRHDINLSNMIVTRIQSSGIEELVDPDLGFDNDISIRRMVMAVAELAFRCLQQEREVRPSMDEVVEILKRIKREEMSDSPETVNAIRYGGGDDIWLLRNGGGPPPQTPETANWTNSLNSNTTSASSF